MNNVSPKDWNEAVLIGQDPLRAADEAATRPACAVTAAELERMEFAPVQFVIQNYIATGLTLLAGRPKRGKSWLCLHAAFAVASGGSTLGEIKCDQGDVIYYALEDNERRIQERIKKMFSDRGWPERLGFEFELPKLKDGGLAHVENWIASVRKPKLIIIDTLAKVRDPRGRTDTPYESDYSAVEKLKRLADTHNVAVVLVHHQRKMEAEDPLDSVSGTTGLTGAVDTVLVLDHSSQGARLYGRGRDIEEIDSAIEFDKASCTWRLLGQTHEVYRSGERKAVLELLTDAENPMSPRDIADALKKSQPAVRQLLKRMHEARELEKTGRGQYRLPCHDGHSVTADGDGDQGYDSD